MNDPVNIDELREQARHRLEPMVYDYWAGGSDDEETLRANRTGWSAWRLVHRVFQDVREIDTTTRLLGADLSFPVLTAPCAFNGLGHPDGELAVARAAGQAGIIQVLSTASTTPLESVAAEVPDATRWFQLYVYRDRALTLDLVRRAEEAGYAALCVTVDVPVAGNRERDIRNAFHLPPGIRWANLDHLMGGDHDGSALTRYIHERWDRNLSLDTIAWLLSETRLPVLVKGVMDPRDAAEAASTGIAGLVVSNHGGRQLDGAVSTAELLPEVAAAVAGRSALLVDGGIRRGTHILKALRLGADAVLIGRPYLWGLACNGEQGVSRVLGQLRAELETAMALCGCRTVADCRDVGLRGGPAQ